MNHSGDDEAAIRDLFRKLLDDWGGGDGQAYGSCFTEGAGVTHLTFRVVK